jgi:FPC/CPF motif-containing protein YcgG
VSSSNKETQREFKNFVLNKNYPCLGAKASLKSTAYRFGHYSELGSSESAKEMANDLLSFSSFRNSINSNFATFVAIFDGPTHMDEIRFENLLWKQLNELHLLDKDPWDSSVSSDPESSQFGFSFGNNAYFIIGLHPNSTRLARRFSRPALVFNAHSQFDFLRESGKYQKMQQVIRNRDKALQGSINPMVAEFGTASEAKQYSGRQVSDNWKCPFLLKN